MQDNTNLQIILDDIFKKTGRIISKKDITFFTDGASDSIVFKYDNYLIKTVDKMTLKNQIEFLNLYNNCNYFQKIIFYNEELNYICFEYIAGDIKKEISTYDIKPHINMLKDIVSCYKEYTKDGFGYLGEEVKTWYTFLLQEVKHSHEMISDINVCENIIYSSLDTLKNVSINKKLIHGDFGYHNFVVTPNNSIKVIDPMPVIGDYLYDFYFSILSNAFIVKNLDIDYVLSFFENEDIKKKKALFNIVFFIRMCRCYKYNRQDFKYYLDIFEKIKEG